MDQKRLSASSLLRALRWRRLFVFPVRRVLETDKPIEQRYGSDESRKPALGIDAMSMLQVRHLRRYPPEDTASCPGEMIAAWYGNPAPRKGLLQSFVTER